MTTQLATPTAADLRAAFDAPAPLTVGLEEEAFVLDGESLDLAPRAAELLAALDGDPAFKLELPAAQLEIVTPPAASVPAALTHLARGRRRLDAAARTHGLRLAAAGVHPFAQAEGVLSEGERYEGILAEYGLTARRQLVCGLQVHVAVGGAERSLAVYNALRAHLPELAALAANAPFHAGRDTGLASVRPQISESLPRQGVPPVISSWDAFAEALRWGAAAGTVREPRLWWWELRPHVAYGTLELRVPDAQTTLCEAAGIAAVAHCLVGWLAERHDAGERLEPAPTWRIEENRWSACRHGLEGTLADLETGERQPSRERLGALLVALGPTAQRLGCTAELGRARLLAEANGAERQRAVAREAGLGGLVAWLADGYGKERPR